MCARSARAGIRCAYHGGLVVLVCGTWCLVTAAWGQVTSSNPAVPLIRPGDNLTVVGVPEIPLTLADAVRRYTEARGAAVLDWHPTERSLLISTRFGNSSQVHRVQMPLGARYQLTFFTEPVSTASYEPQSGSYFLYTKDTGGDEFAQIYRYDMATGESTCLTDGKRSQNGGGVWNHAHDQLAYNSTSRNGADRDIWLMNPRDPQSNRMLLECSGGGWAVLDWSPDDTRLLVQESLSVNKSVLYLVDVRTAKKELLTDREAEVSYRGAAFAADGKGLYLTSDAAGEFQQLGWMDLTTHEVTWLSRDFPWDVESIELSHDRGHLAFVVNAAGVSQAYVLDTASRAVPPRAHTARWRY